MQAHISDFNSSVYACDWNTDGTQSKIFSICHDIQCNYDYLCSFLENSQIRQHFTNNYKIKTPK